MTSPTESLEDQIAAILPPCVRCGKPHTRTFLRQDIPEMLEIDARMRVDAPGLHCTVMELAKTLHCPPCAREKADEMRRERNQDRILAIRGRCYERDWLPKAAKKATFAHSKVELEAKNAELWQNARNDVPLKENRWYHGFPGCGKTFLARCVLNAHIEHGHTVAELNAVDLCRTADSFPKGDPFMKYREPWLLLIDDLDKPSWSTRSIDALYSILHARSENKLRLIVTANATRDVIEHSWCTLRPENASVARSIIERMAPMQRVHIEGQSIRMEQQKAGVEQTEIEPQES